MLSERILDLLALIETHASSIDEDGLKTVADGLAHEGRADSAIHTATNSTKDECSVTNKIPDASDLEPDEVAHFPIRLSSADVNAEVAQDIGSTRCLNLNVRGRYGVVLWGTNVFELGVELDT